MWDKGITKISGGDKTTRPAGVFFFPRRNGANSYEIPIFFNLLSFNKKFFKNKCFSKMAPLLLEKKYAAGCVVLIVILYMQSSKGATKGNTILMKKIPANIIGPSVIPPRPHDFRAVYVYPVPTAISHCNWTISISQNLANAN